MTSDKILGIDLGTTHSAVAVIEGGTPEIIENKRGNRVTPSVVALKQTDGEEEKEEDEWLVGEPAASQEASNPDGTVRSFKRDMGDDTTYDLNGTEARPEELSAKVLRSLKEDAQRFLGIPDDERDKDMKAVITVPAYFSSAQRRATRKAAEIAGLNPLETFDEPTAAALAYARRDAKIKEENGNATEKQNLLVFDLGGGTLDVTVMEYGGAVDNVLSTSGNTALGGDDWDAALTDHIASIIEDETGLNPIDNDDISLTPEMRLRDAIRNAKEDLSDAKEVTINLPFLFPTDDGMYNLEYSLTRAEFEDATASLLDEIVSPVETAIEQAANKDETHKPDEFSHRDIDAVLLVGGATRMPQIQQKVEELVSQEPKATINPDEVVAKGAAFKAGSHSGEVTGVTLLDVVPLSIGLKVRNGLFERIIHKNKTRPIEVTETFTTSAANQTSVNVEVYQGEREIATENEKLGDFLLTGIPPSPAGTPQINVTFSIDDDGILSVKAEESVTGVNKEVTIEGREHGLDQDDIDRLKREAEEHAQHDSERRRNIDIRNDAEKAVQRGYTLLDNQRDAISPELEQNIRGAMNEVEKYIDLLRNDEGPIDYDALRQRTKELNTEVEQIGRDVYQPDDAYQDESIDVEHPEKDSKSGVAREPEETSSDQTDTSDTDKN